MSLVSKQEAIDWLYKSIYPIPSIALENYKSGINIVEKLIEIKDENGKVLFSEKCMFPDFWSETACKIVASKYFRKINGVRENHIFQLIDRVVNAIAKRGLEDGYFGDKTVTRTDSKGKAYDMASEYLATCFKNKLGKMIINQVFSFNSPVWFNLGAEENPQCSACFILSVEDTMESILEWYKTEGMIFKGGSGSGINLSKIRPSTAQMSAGGYASGPVSFMRGADSIAGVIKSGGKTRRAAKMVILNWDHDDILEFITCKSEEEKKVYALGAAGYDMSLNGEAWKSIQYQNANNSVRLDGNFFKEVKSQNQTANTILNEIARCAWECGDPGVQFDHHINAMHTTPTYGRINGSNPCSEYMHIDNSSCNLASINLVKFLTTDPMAQINNETRHEPMIFDVNAFLEAVKFIIIAQDIIVSISSYPTKLIENNTKDCRQLGIGFTNLGSTLMMLSMPYASSYAHKFASIISSIMTGFGYLTSSYLSNIVGSCNAYTSGSLDPDSNKGATLVTLSHHSANHIKHIINLLNDEDGVIQVFNNRNAILNYFSIVHDYFAKEKTGLRNTQISVIAPTGTISFMMDASTTGIEPELALVKYKTLVGGGVLRLVNENIKTALYNLYYSDTAINGILRYIEDNGNIENCPIIIKDHKDIFLTSFKNENGSSYLGPVDHLMMMAAVQPFISGAISKTVNLPETATVEDIKEMIILANALELKAVAFYRDGSKNTQPVSVKKDTVNVTVKDLEIKSNVNFTESNPRQHLPATRESLTHVFRIEGHKGYITAGYYPNGKLGEIFVSASKDGSTLSGLLGAFSMAISIALQSGIPFETLRDKMMHITFSPYGFTGNQDIPSCTSIIDYVFKWLDFEFPNGVRKGQLKSLSFLSDTKTETQNTMVFSGHNCVNCGSITVKTGTCNTCLNCGTTSGCA